MFKMPQFQDVAGGSIASALQARPDSTDYAILTASHDLTGVSGTGCAVTPQGSPNMTVAVAGGTIYVAGAAVVVTGGNVTIATAHSSQPRRDIVVVNSSGVKSAVAGTAAADPVKPAIPANSVVLAEVYVPALDTTISATQIVDKRVAVRLPVVTGLPIFLRKSAVESVASSITLQDDNHLFFAIAANEVWAVRLALIVTGAPTGQLRLNFSAPAGCVWNASGQGVLGGQDVNTIRDSVSNTFDIAWDTPATPSLYVVELVVANGGTAGTFRLRWAQVASNVTPTNVLANSYLTRSLL